MKAGLLALVLAALAGTSPPPPRPERIAKDVWLIPGGLPPGRQPDGNTVVFKGPEGFVVVDTGRHAWHRQAIVDLVQSQGGRVAGVVNTHWHLDHVSGNAELKRRWPEARVHSSRAVEGALTGFLARGASQSREALAGGGLAPVIADELQGDLATVQAPAALRPDLPVERSGVRRIGGRALQLNLARRAATEGDVWVYDPSTRVLAAGDLVTLPAPFLDTACPEGWRSALEDLSKAPFERLAPGHGRVLNRAELSLYGRAFGALLECAKGQGEAAACAEGWTTTVTPLLGAEPGEAKIARAMTANYVAEVLRKPEATARACGVGA